ncbi:MAG: hypothetical protein ACFFFC_16150 [Candidatus Thorarchaeota archaeon]
MVSKEDGKKRSNELKDFSVSGTCFEITWTDQDEKRIPQVMGVEYSTTIRLPKSIMRFRSIRSGASKTKHNYLESILPELLYVEHAMCNKYYIRALRKLRAIEVEWIETALEATDDSSFQWEGPPVLEIQPFIERHRNTIVKDIERYLLGRGFNIDIEDVTRLTKIVSNPLRWIIAVETLEDEIITLLDGLLRNETRVLVLEPPYPKSFDQLFCELTNKEVKEHFKQLSLFRKQFEKKHKGKRTPWGEPSKSIERFKTQWLQDKQCNRTKLREFIQEISSAESSVYVEHRVYAFVVFREFKKLRSSIAYSLGLKEKGFEIRPGHVWNQYQLLASVLWRINRYQ